MRTKIQRRIIDPKLVLVALFSFFILFSPPAEGQRNKKKSKTNLMKQTALALGKLNAHPGLSAGSGDIVLENYTGAPLKALQFRIIATSMCELQSVLPGSTISDKKKWSCHHVIVSGTPDASGKRSDTIRVVIFGNGLTELPSGANIKLLTLSYQQPAVNGTSADTVSIKTTDVVGALSLGEAPRIEAGTEASINLWK